MNHLKSTSLLLLNCGTFVVSYHFLSSQNPPAAIVVVVGAVVVLLHHFYSLTAVLS